MHPIHVLPNVPLQNRGPVAKKYLQQGLTTFHDACRWTKALPYGNNSNKEDSLILFEEGHGTCTTKHWDVKKTKASPAHE